MAHSASSGSGRRSWRESGAAPAAAPHSKAFARWFFSLLALALVALLIWILIPTAGNRTHLVVLPIKAYDKLVVPPIPFAAEDAKSLADSTALSSTSLDLLQTSAGIAGLSARLRDQVTNPRDALLVYISAHGMSSGDTAYLLCSDYRRSAAPGWCKVSDLLNQARSTPAAAKLLVLDCGSLATDARLGLVVNEFSRLLDKEVAACSDTNLWVLVPNSLLQSSGVSYSQRRSILGQCLSEALNGAADTKEELGNADGKVSLQELYRYVAGRSGDWGDLDSGSAQTPLLMRGGIGIVDLEKNPQDIKPDPILIAVRPPKSAEEDSPDKKDAEKADKGPAEPTKETKQSSAPRRVAWPTGTLALLQAPTDASTTPAKPAAEPDKKPPAPSDKPDAAAAETKPAEDAPPVEDGQEKESKPAPRPAKQTPPPAAPQPTWTEQLAAVAAPEVVELAAAWELRDQLQSRKLGRGWSPIDFAPHYWRRLNALLLASERQLRSGSDSQGLALLAELKALRRGLQSLSDAIEQDAAPPPAPTVMATEDRLLEAWRRFRVCPQRLSWESASSQASEIKSALQLYADLVFAAPDYVAWHDETSFIVAAKPQFRDLDELLRQLASLSQPLETLEPGVADFPGVLAEDLQSLREVRDRIDQQLADETARAHAELQDPDTANGSAERICENLLATPLLAARPRIELLQVLLGAKYPLPKRSERRLPKNPRDMAVGRQQWQRLLERTLLHQQIVQLADPAANSTLAGAIQAVQQLSANSAGKESELLERYRTIGGALEKHYDSLPRTLAGAGSEVDPAAAWRLGLLARLIDPRDVRDGEQYPDLFPRALPPPPEVPRQLTVTAPLSPLQAELKTWQAAEWEIATAGKGEPTALVVLKFPADLLEVRSAEGKHEPAAENREFPVQLGPGGKRLLKFEVRARKDREQARPKAPPKLEVAVTWEQQRQSAASDWTLPLADSVDLVVRREGSQYEQLNRGERLSLRPYPNRQTGFRFSLANRSGKSKQVKVDLFAARRPVTATWAPGRMFTTGGKLRPGIYQEHFDSEGILSWRVKLLASTGPQPLELPADSSARPLALLPPGAAPTAEPDKDKKDAPAAKPAAAAEPPAEDITDGLLCIIRDASDEKVRWIKWIELAPLAPHDYLAAAVAYDPAKERLEIQITPARIDENGREVSPKEVLPPDIAEKPIKVAWDLDEEVKVKKISLEYGLAQPVGTLWAEVPPDGAKRKVRLAVDQYPRALVYDVLCDRVPRTVDLKPTLQDIHIERVSLAGYGRMFRFDDSTDLSPPQWIGTGEKKQQLLTIASSEVAPFPAPCEALHVLLSVDAPKDAFELPLIDREDAIEVVLGDDQDRRRFFSERQISAVLKKLDPQGLLVIETSVGDYQFDLKPEGLQGQEAPIVARLMLAGAVAAGPHRVRVLLDGSEPEILNFATKPAHTLPLVIGTPLKAELRVKDQSGVERVEFGFDKDSPGTLEKVELLGELKKAPVNGAYGFDLDTKELKPGEYNLLAKVTDRVGFEAYSRPLLLTVVAPPAPPSDSPDPKNPTAPPAAKKGVIRGVVKYRTATADEDLVTVTLEGTDQPPQRTGRNGEFKFSNVPPGSYTLKAEGSFQNRQRSGELKNVMPSPPDTAPLLVVPVN